MFRSNFSSLDGRGRSDGDGEDLQQVRVTKEKTETLWRRQESELEVAEMKMWMLCLGGSGLRTPKGQHMLDVVESKMVWTMSWQKDAEDGTAR